jgi:uncharacterized phage protein (TIGR02218 family)
MKSLSNDLKSAIASGRIATLYTLTCKDGTVARHTDFDAPLTHAGNVFTPAAGLARVQLSLSVGASVSSQSIASAWLAAPEAELLSGKYDNASVDVFFGRLGKIGWSADGFNAEVHSIQRELGKRIGAEVTAQCRHVLGCQASPEYPGFCGVNTASYEFTGTITGQPLPASFTVSVDVPQAADYFAKGLLIVTSGVLNGKAFEIKKNATASSIELCLPPPAGLDVGTTIKLRAGCDGTYATCKSKFSNGSRFGGFPHIKVEAQWQ